MPVQHSLGRSLLIGGNPGRYSWNDPNPPQPPYANGIEAWIYALGGDYWGPDTPPASIVHGYDLVIANLNFNLLEQYTRLAVNRPPHQKWVSLIEGGVEIYTDRIPWLKEAMDSSDLVASINSRSTDFLRAITTARTEMIGIPYPLDEIQKFSTPVEDRRDEVLICPRTSKLPSVVVGQQLDLSLLMFEKRVHRRIKNIPEFWKYRRYDPELKVWLAKKEFAGTRVSVHLENEIEDFWRIAGGARLWINLDHRYTWARYVLDAAALGVPIIATRSTGHAEWLFPELTVEDEFSISQAVSMGRRLLDEPEFANAVVSLARERMSVYSGESTVQRLVAALQN